LVIDKICKLFDIRRNLWHTDSIKLNQWHAPQEL
jgi:hypothetical protein